MIFEIYNRRNEAVKALLSNLYSILVILTNSFFENDFNKSIEYEVILTESLQSLKKIKQIIVYIFYIC
jgi:hypothetical protein